MPRALHRGLTGVPGRVALGIAITAATLAWAFDDRQVRAQIGAVWAGGAGWLWQPVLASLAVITIRAWRLAVVLRLPFGWRVLRLSSLHQTANILLPLKLGELALPLLIRRELPMGFAAGLGTLVAIRLWDLAVLAAAAALALAFTAGGLAPWLGPAVTIGGGAALLLFGAAVWAAPRITAHLAAATPHGRVGRVLRDLARGAFGHDRAVLIGVVLTTLAAWLAVFAGFHVVALHQQATPGPAATVLGAIASSIAFALPVNGVGTIGATQAAYAGTLALFEVPIASALATALIWHAVAVVTTIAVAAPGLATLTRRPPTRHRPAADTDT